MATTTKRADIKAHRLAGDAARHLGFSVDTISPSTSAKQPYINISYAPTLAGYAVLDSVVYGDISGDGFDEAIITVYSGGTAGNTACSCTSSTPQTSSRSSGPNDFYTSFGYKVDGQVDKGDLVVSNVVGAGWEAQLLPVGLCRAPVPHRQRPHDTTRPSRRGRLPRRARLHHRALLLP